jgi:hypothetical protein
MNAVCTNIVHLNKCHLQNYGGNYDSFIRTRLELLENQAKRYKWEQDQISHMKVIIVLNVFKLIIENKRTYPYYMSLNFHLSAFLLMKLKPLIKF